MGRTTTTPSALAEYAFCPRAHYYREHPPAEGPAPGALDRETRGVAQHSRTLRRVRRHARFGAIYALALVGGLGLAIAGLLLLWP